MILKTGAIYSLRYAYWKTNYKIYALVLWPGGGITKTHLLNLGAKQLSILDRTRIIRTIVRLSKVPNANKYDGRMLYKIFKTYLNREISKCYRTFHTYGIVQASLINYGLNKEEDFSEIELSSQSKELFNQAQKDFQVKAMNLYSGRGAKLNSVKETMAGSSDSNLIQDDNSGISGSGKPNVNTGTHSATHSAIKENQNNDNTIDNDDGGDDGTEFGY